ncbi:MAG: molybdenum cofactor guanylyltransferase [Limnochordia bacterium]|jgi:molybdopterin-guanine dinucleotide biosynthesis protein A
MSLPLPDVTGLLLAGGRGSRLGGNKLLLDFHGQPLIYWAAKALVQTCQRVLLVTNNPESFQFLGLPMVADIYRDCGPLGGIHAGLAAQDNPHCLVVGADMPFIDPRVLKALTNYRWGWDLVVPSHGGLPEYLHAVYSRRCLPAMEECLNQGKRRIRDMASLVKERMVPADRLTQRPEQIFFNINTPADLERGGVLFCP